MELYRQSGTLTEDLIHALPMQHMVSNKYQLLEAVSADDLGITYLVEESETKTKYHVYEFLPADMAERMEDGLTIHAVDEVCFQKQKNDLLSAAKKLIGQSVPHLVCPLAYFEENETVYLVLPAQEAEPLDASKILVTAMYLRSLAISLCDTYAALHRLKLCYGKIAEQKIMLHADGTFHLRINNIWESALSGESDRTLDLHMLTSFLSDLFLLADSESESQTVLSSYAVMKNVLQYRYHDADLLKSALLCPDNSLDKPRTSVSSGKSVFRIILCLVFLLLGIAGIGSVGISRLPLGLCMKLKLIQPDVISVWMPLDENAQETETLEMYRKLTAGFERMYPGYGINLVIYADNSFSDALQFAQTGVEPPTVFMNSRHETVTELASDLSPLLRSLDDSYLVDLNVFSETIPLGCSLPALYYNAYSCEEMGAETIELSEIDVSICYDVSVASFIHTMDRDAGREESEFSLFMDGRSEQPFLASTSCLSVAERTGITSGAIRMLPISVDGTYPLQYEMYCSVNRNKDWNSRHIGMLWLQYLLTEEAQQIMFAENYSALPLHGNVLPQTIANHSALSVVESIRTELNSTALQ